MSRTHLPILPTFAAVYRDGRRMVRPLRTVLLCGFLIILALAAAAEFVPQRLWDEELSGTLLGLIQDAIWAFLLTPVVIAVHRFVILGEAAPPYALAIGEPGFRLFFAWLLALKILAGLPIDLLGVLQVYGVSVWASTLFLVVATIVAVAISLRLTILLPAIAVQARGASPAQAAADSKGETLRIFAVMVLVLLPWFIASMVGTMLLGRGVAVTGSPAMMASLVMGAVLLTIVLAFTAVVASHAFMVLAVRVNLAGKR